MNTEIHYETLDPENWDEMRALSHRMRVPLIQEQWMHIPSVHFLNKDVWLNCCGVHSISIFLDKETGDFEIEETDDP